MENIKNNLPVYSVILLTISLVRLQFYYSSFGIDIVSYIEASEALLLSIPFFVYSIFTQAVILVTVAAMMVLIVISNIITRRIFKKNKASSGQAPKPTNDDETLWQYLKRKKVPIFNTILFSIAGFMALSKGDMDFATIYWCAAAFLVLGEIGGSNIFDFIKNVIRFDRETFNTVFLTIRLSILCIVVAKFQANYVKILPSRTKALIVFDNGKKVVTSPNYRFVGKTKDFVFFYDIKLKRGDSYPLDDAKSIKIIEPTFFGLF